MDNLEKEPIRFSYANLSNLDYLEKVCALWKKDPHSVDSSWALFFEGWYLNKSGIESLASTRQQSPDLRIFNLIESYRSYGHLIAAINPIAIKPIPYAAELDLKNLNFKEEELDQLFPTCGFLKEETAPLRTLIEALKKTYGRTIGIEYKGLETEGLDSWVQKKIEPYFQHTFSSEEKKAILYALNQAELFESFIHTKYLGQKRFSLEGAETLIPLLKTLVTKSLDMGIEEIVIGMAHRGRLNVLANILEKSYADIFTEFEDYYSPDLMESVGDVKYHKGYQAKSLSSSGKEVLISLTPNPSHLESVDPVVEGLARGKQESLKNKKAVLPVIIHGDAAVAGQGVVYETVQLGKLDGYASGGTLHIVINNQIGFTALPEDSRSTRYCTAIGRAFGSPIFHVNAEDPEGCVYALILALEIRQLFGIDVFIDLNGYRKYGHNEGDEPSFTQPIEYQIIKSKKSIRSLYVEALINGGVLSREEAEKIEAEFKRDLEQALDKAKIPPEMELKDKKIEAVFPVKTAIGVSSLQEMAKKVCTIPSGFNIYPKLENLLVRRLKMVESKNIDWAMAEQLAFASLLDEGVSVRLSGQDSTRGTFSQRHAKWIDQKNGSVYYPLAQGFKGSFSVFASPLSEFGVLGFELGYALARPDDLVIWEAQYGDFVNGAQIMLDQYIMAGEQRWGVSASLTILLPHGYEGQGAEHSSGRLERFLQMCADDNIRVANCTTPANYFHLLRLQAKNSVKKPLIVMTPKAFLRHPENISSLESFSSGSFESVIDEEGFENAKTLAFCSGKVYFDLTAERKKREDTSIAFVRIERLYPFPEEEVQRVLAKYRQAKNILWVQEEHSNMGAWEYVRDLFGREISYRGRKRSSVSAAGSHALHKKQYEIMMEEVFKNG